MASIRNGEGSRAGEGWRLPTNREAEAGLIDRGLSRSKAKRLVARFGRQVVDMDPDELLTAMYRRITHADPTGEHAANLADSTRKKREDAA